MVTVNVLNPPCVSKPQGLHGNPQRQARLCPGNASQAMVKANVGLLRHPSVRMGIHTGKADSVQVVRVRRW